MTEKELPTPFFIVYEDRLRANLELISRVGRESGADIIMAFKANALWRTFDIVREYCRNCTASSVNELMLGAEYMGGEIHSFTPAYTDSNIDVFLRLSSHITFNSLSQYERFAARTAASNASAGLRVNPKCSVIDTDLYNPALPGSRFGVDALLPRVCLQESTVSISTHSASLRAMTLKRFLPPLRLRSDICFLHLSG